MIMYKSTILVDGDSLIQNYKYHFRHTQTSLNSGVNDIIGFFQLTGTISLCYHCLCV